VFTWKAIEFVSFRPSLGVLRRIQVSNLRSRAFGISATIREHDGTFASSIIVRLRYQGSDFSDFSDFTKVPKSTNRMFFAIANHFSANNCAGLGGNPLVQKGQEPLPPLSVFR
jgi:hypothetical protein